MIASTFEGGSDVHVRLVGEIAISSGALVLIDPEHIDGLWGKGYLEAKYGDEDDIPLSLEGAEDAATSEEGAGMLMRWVAASVRTGPGSGTYPVFAEYNRKGEIQRIYVRFLEDEPKFEYVPLAEVIPQPGEEPKEPVRAPRRQWLVRRGHHG